MKVFIIHQHSSKVLLLIGHIEFIHSNELFFIVPLMFSNNFGLRT